MKRQKWNTGILSGKVETLVSFPLSFNGAITTALLPSIAASRRNLKKQEERINKSILFGTMITIPIIMIFLFWGDEILKILFPNASSGAIILKISSISIFFITITQMFNVILYGIGQSKIPIIAVTIGVIVKAVLNNILIPRVDLTFGGTKGAALATVMYNAVIFTVSFIAVKKYTNIKIHLSSIIKPVVASLFMILCSKITNNILSGRLSSMYILVCSFLMSLIVYIISLFLLKIFNKNDIFFIKLKRKN